MVRLQVISDLHLEHRNNGPINYLDFIIPSAEVLALVGDIGSPYDSKLSHFLDWCSRNFRIVLYVPGNHEYYSTFGDTYTVIYKELERICAQFENVHLFHNKTLEVDDVMFIGSTLWSYIPPDKDALISNCLNDFRIIYSKPETPITPQDVRNEFAANKHFIEVSLAQAMTQCKKAVVLTHHAPSFQDTSHPQYANSDSCYGFASCFSVQPGAVRLWCCGHTHYNFHHNKEGYELYSNQVGYHTPITGFDPCKVFNLSSSM